VYLKGLGWKNDPFKSCRHTLLSLARLLLIGQLFGQKDVFIELELLY
jgi:hypothetical protein